MWLVATCRTASFLDFLTIMKSDSDSDHHFVIFVFSFWSFMMLTSVAYFSLSLNAPNLCGNAYLNCFLSALIEIPAYITAWLLQHPLPRHYIIAGVLFLGGGVLLLVHLAPAGKKLANINTLPERIHTLMRPIVVTAFISYVNICGLYIRTIHKSSRQGRVSYAISCVQNNSPQTEESALEIRKSLPAGEEQQSL